MKLIPQKLASALLAVAGGFAVGQQQDATPELRVLDIMARQPKEVIAASVPCQRAWKSPNHGVVETRAIDPQTLFQDLGTLMEKSDEVVLAGRTYRSIFVVSPSGERAVTYFEVKVIRSWKGSHNVGDVLTFGIPAGVVNCGETETHSSVYFSTMFGTADWPRGHLIGPFVLFLHKPQGKEAQLVDGLLPSGGEGMQGMFSLQLSSTSKESRQCNGVLRGTLEWCDTFLDTSDSPIIVPYAHDPLARQYAGMPISEFLHEIRVMASDKGLYEKSTTLK